MNAPPLILALDLGTLTGCAEGRAGDRVPRLWTWRLGARDASHAERWAELLRLTADHCKVSKPDRLWIEAPLPARAQVHIGNQEPTIRFLFGAAAIVHAVARMRGLWSISEAHIADVRRSFCKVGRYDRDAKAAVQAQCRVLGWRFRNDNEADAAALWAYACARTNPRTAHLFDPLFHERQVEAPT